MRRQGDPARGAQVSSLPALSVDVASGPVFLLAPWEVWVCYKDILGVSQTQVCLVGSTFGLKYRGYRSPKNEKWGCECLRCGGGGSGQAGPCAGRRGGGPGRSASKARSRPSPREGSASASCYACRAAWPQSCAPRKGQGRRP